MKANRQKKLRLIWFIFGVPTAVKNSERCTWSPHYKVAPLEVRLFFGTDTTYDSGRKNFSYEGSQAVSARPNRGWLKRR